MGIGGACRMGLQNQNSGLLPSALVVAIDAFTAFVLTWLTAALVSVIYAFSTLVLAWFGVHDIARGLTFPVRLRAAIMIAAAILLFAATVGALIFQRTGSHAAGVLLILGGVTAIGFGLALLSSQLLEGDYTPWLWAWLIMTAGGVWATIRVLQTGQRLPYPKQFAWAVTFTAVLAAANFAYSSLYQPTTQLYTWALEVDFGKPALNPNKTSASIPITVSFENKGKVPVNVLMATYSVVGRRGSVAEKDRTRKQLRLSLQSNQPASRRTVVDGYDLLQADHFIAPGSWLEAGDRTDIGRTVDLPLPTRYDTIALNAWILVTRRDRATLNGDLGEITYSWDHKTGQHVIDAPGWVAKKGIDTVRYQVPISESSFLREEVRKDWVATVWWVLANPELDYPAGPFLSWRMAPYGSELDTQSDEIERDNQRAFDRYGVNWWDTGLYEQSVHSLGLPKASSANDELRTYL